ncbi:MAG: DNA polymerase I, partial [Thermodesulfobacteriota bacterium]|nr:DNA polymerase I [Thermodesulfobacteriota bacterium]
MTQDREIVYLVDGSSYIYRAYHAIKHLSNSKGFPTNAILGFTKMILKLIKERKPHYLAIVFDAKGPTFRHKIYKDYKATRPPMPDDLVEQVPYIKKIVKGLNIRMIEREGYEADDVIGTLARMSEEESFPVVVVSGDKDFRQIISPRISLWDSMKDSFTDYGTLIREFGLEPEQFIDLMGLSGDSSDNIPGVAGIGEKIALDLIKQFGTLENVFENLQEIKKKRLKENLEKSRAEAIMSKKLVTIDRFVPVNEMLKDLEIREPRNQELIKIFRELEFRGLWDQFATRFDRPKKDYDLCLSEEELFSLIKQIREKGMVSIDTETTSHDPLKAKLVGISFACEEERAYYLPLAHHYIGAPAQLAPSKALNILAGILADEKIHKVGQNIKYDALVLKRHGVVLKGIHFDTMIASYVINPGLRQHNLDYLAQHYLNYKMITYNELVGKGKNEISFSSVEVERAKEYSCEDADITLRLMSILDGELQSCKNQDLFNNIEMKLLPVLMDMELAGIKINVDFFKRMSQELSIQIKAMEKEIYEEAGMEFNINSPQQLGYILFEKLQLPVQKKTAKTRAYSTDVRVLKKLSVLPYKIPRLLLRYRTLSKLKSTYLDALVKMIDSSTGRIHTSFNQTVTATGRLSSSNPNLQNIPI